MSNLNTISKCVRATRNNSLLGLALYRSFSRCTNAHRHPQITMNLGMTADEKQRVKNHVESDTESSWVNITCVAFAVLGLGFSCFSTRQLCDDPNRRVLWKK